MQDLLFPEDTAPRPAAPAVEAPAAPAPSPRPRGAKVAPAAHDASLTELARALPPQLRLGTSSWSYPGWRGLVWEGEHSESALSRHGLSAYAQHPLFRSVSLDRAFYRPLSVLQYANLALQVPADFRFVVKAPLTVTDAMVRAENGQGQQPNPVFLSPELAVNEFVQPALDGLGARVGALVFQLSPLPLPLLARLDEVLDRLRAMLAALPTLRPTAPDGVIAVEVRDPEFLTPAFAQVLRDTGATFCLGLHTKMPPIEQQLPMLRALWPGPLVCRWNMNRRFGPYGYQDAEKRYLPFDRTQDPDPENHAALARVIAGTLKGGQPAYVTLSNHAEGCAPNSVRTLAEAVVGAVARTT